MKITKMNPLTGKDVTKDLPITNEQYHRWQNGELVQLVMPHLSSDDREFLISGIPDQASWDRLFNDPQDHD